MNKIYFVDVFWDVLPMAWLMREAYGKMPNKCQLMKLSLLLLFNRFVKIIHVKLELNTKRFRNYMQSVDCTLFLILYFFFLNACKKNLLGLFIYLFISGCVLDIRLFFNFGQGGASPFNPYCQVLSKLTMVFFNGRVFVFLKGTFLIFIFMSIISQQTAILLKLYPLFHLIFISLTIFNVLLSLLPPRRPQHTLPLQNWFLIFLQHQFCYVLDPVSISICSRQCLLSTIFFFLMNSFPAQWLFFSSHLLLLLTTSSSSQEAVFSYFLWKK